MVICLIYWLPLPDAIRNFTAGNCDDECIAVLVNQGNAYNTGIWAVLSGLAGAVLFFFRSKQLSGAVLIFVSGFIFYGYLSSSLFSDSSICELPDDKGFGEIPPAECTAYNYAGPSVLSMIGGWLVFRGIRDKPLIPLRTA
jgi:hypothetical protein